MAGGLDTRGGMDGFAQGFGLVTNLLAQKDQKEIQRAQLAQHAEDRQYGREIQQQEMGLRKDDLAYRRETDQRNYADTQDQRQYLRQRDADNASRQDRQFQASYGLQAAGQQQAAARMQREDQRFDLQQQQLTRQMSRQDKAELEQKDALIARSAYAKIAAGGDLDDNDLEVFKRNPWFDPRHVLAPSMQADVQTAGKVFSGDLNSNSPEALDAVNRMFAPNIQQGGGGKKRIVQVLPGRTEGTVAFELEVTGDDGKKYTAPMTKSRGTATDADDEVLEMPIDKLVDRVSGYKLLNGVFSIPENRQAALRYGQQMGLAPKDQMSKPLAAPIQKAEDGDLDAIANAQTMNQSLGRISKQISDGKLNLGPIANRVSEVRNSTGTSTEESRNYGSLNATLERLRNDSLRLNAGVQTDGDAQRAWNELVTNLNDPKLVQQRLDEISSLNEKAIQLKTNMIQQRRQNARAEPLDIGTVIPQAGSAQQRGLQLPQATAPARQQSAAAPSIATDDDYNRLPSGTVFIDPNGKQRVKP
ncbi:hypothetical protein [Pseudomonas yamanorum]|uniref:hypothetical protein n=1 Tax=Pseudomonas yamanorum TaxID=515393 RepID=UPI003B9F0A80